jgi:SAM-dependent methyltransferase
MHDLGGAYSAVLVYIGDKLGLYNTMNDEGKPISSHELATLTKTSERNVREWLANQAAGGYVTYNKEIQKYWLPPENTLALVDEDSPVFAMGAFQGTMSFFRDAPKVIEAFKTGRGLPWGEHDPDLFVGTERFFKPNYNYNLVSSWIPSLNNGKVQQKMEKERALVADVGCGHGISTIIMAKAYPNSRFIGFDNHQASIERARELAREEGLSQEQIKFEDFSANDYYHYSEANLNLVSRMYYAASTMVCVPGAMAFTGPALGAQAGEAKTGEVVKAGGFKQFRRTTQTQFNIVYEARP